MASDKIAIFTICSNNYLPMAKVLFTSAARYCTEAILYLCLADRRLSDAENYPTNVNVIAAEDLAIPDFCNFAFRYTIMEFNTALKPFMIRHLLDKGFDTVLYFDPDIELFASLDVILEPLRAGYSFVLTPHICQPAEGDNFPDDIGIMRAGVYNLGFLGVSVGRDTERLLRWWSRRLRYHCVSDQARGVFVDQKFMDLLPGFTDSIWIVRDTACNVAYWNLRQRCLRQAGDQWLVDEQPMRFFHFSGIDVDDLTYLSKWTQDFRGSDIPQALLALMRHYAAQVIEGGYGTGRPPPYSYGFFESGTPIPDAVRRMFRDRHIWWGGDPFKTYEEYLDLPIADQWKGSSSYIITNLMEDLRQRDPWLLSRFDPLRPEDVEAYTKWFVKYSPDLIGEPALIQHVVKRLARQEQT